MTEEYVTTDDQLRAALAASSSLLAQLEHLRRPHVIVDDCWYSCPKAVDEDGDPACCNDELLWLERCTCGADAHNARLEALIAALKRDSRQSAGKE
jgi:hypothetical protein